MAIFLDRTSGFVLNDYYDACRYSVEQTCLISPNISLLKILCLQLFEGRAYVYVFSIQH